MAQVRDMMEISSLVTVAVQTLRSRPRQVDSLILNPYKTSKPRQPAKGVPT